MYELYTVIFVSSYTSLTLDGFPPIETKMIELVDILLLHVQAFLRVLSDLN